METVAGKAAVCIGVRRSGKSTYLYQLIERLAARGVSRRNVLYLNLFDDRLHRLRRGGLGAIVDAAGELSTGRRLAVGKAFDEYWERGGFPEVAGVGRDLRIRIHQEYFDVDGEEGDEPAS